MNNLGEIIKQSRLAHGFTLEEVGLKVGVTRQAISLFELGKIKPGEVTLKKLIKALGLSSSVLKYIGIKPPGYKICINCEGLGFMK